MSRSFGGSEYRPVLKQYRSGRSIGMVGKEHVAMYPGHPTIDYLRAQSRAADLLAEAERARHLAQLRGSRPTTGIVVALRRRIGTALVSTGEWLQGSPRPQAGGVADASAPSLRLAR